MSFLKINSLVSTILLATLIFPFAASASIETEAQSLEVEMDQVKCDVATTDVKLARQQFQIMLKASKFVHKALIGNRKIDDPTISAVARILVKNYFCDQNGDLAAENFELLAKYSDRLDAALKRLEQQKIYDHQTLEAVRLTMGIAGNLKEHGNDGGNERQPNNSNVKPAPKKNN